MMNGGIQIVILIFVSLSGVNLRAQQLTFDYDNFDGNIAVVSSANAFASSSVVFSNGGFIESNPLRLGQIKALPNINRNSNKINQGHGGPNQAKPKRSGNANANGNGSPGNKRGNAGGNKVNAVPDNYVGNPFLQVAATPKPPARPAPPAKPRPPTKKPAPATQGNKPPKKPASPAVAPAANNKNKNKKNSGAKGKKRVSEIKYEQYLTSIFPDMDLVEDVTDLTGRELAQPGEFPHMGAIGFRNTVLNKTEYKCGASLISNYYAITSAHCTEFNGVKPTYVRFGDLNLKAAEEDVDPQTRKIARVVNHPSYNDDSLYNDIALLQLEKPVILTEFVRPIRLWYRDDVPFTNAFAMGFGAVEFAGAATNRLTEFNLTLIANDVCNKQFPKQPNLQQGIIDSQICAIDLRKSGSDTFQGDSGGPLQISFYGRRRRRLHNNLIGITSFGVLGLNRRPGVYTRISSFVDWIEGIVWSDDYYQQ